MKQFFFRFEKILNYRDHLEKKALKDLMVLRKKSLEKKNLISSLSFKRKENIAQCSAFAMDGMDAEMYKIYQQFTRKLDSDLQQVHMQLQENEKKVNAQEKMVQKATTKKKSLETLKNFKFKNYAEKAAKEEQKFMDEMAVLNNGVKK